MLHLLDPDARVNVKLDESDSSPVIIIGMIDTSARAHILDLMKDQFLTFADRIRLTRHGVKEWALVVDKNSQPVKFETEEVYIPGIGKRNVMSEKCLNYLSEKMLAKISTAVLELNFELEDKEKNSVTPSTL